MTTENISKIKAEFERAMHQNQERRLEELVHRYEKDARIGVQKQIKRAQKWQLSIDAERIRLDKMKQYEREYSHFGVICGIDEAGRGPLAGPVAAGAVILPDDAEILYLNDSKQLSATRREQLYLKIQDKAIAWGVGIIGPERIDEINILQADYEAMCLALGQLKVMPDILLNDAVTIPQVKIRQVPIIKGDAKSVSIAAASIIAKVTRDHLMEEFDAVYPEYGFARNKGYGSAEHIAAIKKYGPCPIHRRSFIKNFI